MFGAYDCWRIDTGLDSRAITFENPTGARGAGGTAAGGRKGAPSRHLAPGETVTLADIEGPGTVRHVWMTVPPAPPEVMRSLWIEVFYDDGAEPSVSVPVLDFFALPHGRPVAFDSAMVSVHEGRGFNAYFPMPFRRRMRMELTNSSPRRLQLYYQVDFTLLEELPTDAGFLHVSFRRENPTTEGEDFVITRGLKGPGRFLGCAVGVRVLDRGPGMIWYGEGEVKVFRDGDTHPTICGTGLEDYVGTAWGMGPYHAHWAGAPLEVRAPDAAFLPDFVGFYRWHVPDPIVFLDELTVTIQQIGYALFTVGQEEEFEALPRPAAGGGWQRDQPPGVIARGICERVDDYCAAAFVYCREPQAVPRVDVEAAREDVERRDFEVPSPYEALLALDAQE